MKFSTTIIGIIVMVAGTLLVDYGFSQECATEITDKIPLLVGAIIAWFGRYNAGGINVFGAKK